MSKLIEVANEEIFAMTQRLGDVLIEKKFISSLSDAVFANLTNLALSILLQERAPEAIRALLQEQSQQETVEAEEEQAERRTKSPKDQGAWTSYAKIPQEAGDEMAELLNPYCRRLEKAIKQAGLWSESKIFQNLLVAAALAAVTCRVAH